jgi:hypothetical protein
MVTGEVLPRWRNQAGEAAQELGWWKAQLCLAVECRFPQTVANLVPIVSEALLTDGRPGSVAEHALERNSVVFMNGTTGVERKALDQGRSLATCSARRPRARPWHGGLNRLGIQAIHIARLIV